MAASYQTSQLIHSVCLLPSGCTVSRAGTENFVSGVFFEPTLENSASLESRPATMQSPVLVRIIMVIYSLSLAVLPMWTNTRLFMVVLRMDRFRIS